MSLEQIYYFLCGAVLTLTIMTLCISVIMPNINHWNKRFLIIFFTIFVLSIISIFVDLIVYDDPNMALIEKITVYFEYLFVSISMPMFTAYLLKTCDENLRKSSLFKSVIFLWIIYFFLLAIAQFTDFIYYVTPNNKYIRGSYYLILVIPVFIIIFLNLASVIKRRDKLKKKYFVAFMIHIISLKISLIINTAIIENLVFVTLGICISNLSMLAIILYDQIESYINQQREISNQRASIMILQMRPHFIYNAMMSIYYLCAKDSKKAQQVTLDFTTYLRKNFTAIASENTVPFSEELEHTRAYLAVEQIQFEDSLFVKYDTPHKNFRLPPLTLQPIVENAVKHGMDPECAPLNIFIKTCETDFGNEITVEDTGPGFNSDEEDFETNNALSNIKQRLEIMCGGELKIKSCEGGGTLVTVIIPK